MAVKLGKKAPDFSLPSHLGKQVRLGDLIGERNIILAFFPLAWTPV